MIRRILVTAFLTLLVASPGFAQQTGQINGVVTDNTGAVVPGATVKAVETATTIPHDTITEANGHYSFTSLRPTTYDLSVELTGFRTSVRKGVLLQANQNVTVNFALELGSLSETVTVSGEAATVDVTSATISEVVDSKRIVELPLNGRDAAKLSTLVPGMVLTEVNKESAKTIPGALRMSTNGTESRQVSFRLDGTSHTDPYFQQNQPFPFPDALQEFSIQTSNYSAGQGNSAGAVVNAITRSGTNSYHGGTFDYVRDGKWNSKNFFSANKDFLKRKQYGGYVGGPIKHNHTFFFTGWQQTHLTNIGSTLSETVPTAEQRTGVFSSAIKDPTTCDAAGKNCQNFANNTIPLDRMDPASLKVLALLPLGNDAGQVQVPRPIGQQDNQWVTKVDQLVGDKNQVSARYFFEQFHNNPTFTPGNLLTYRNPTLQSHVRTQNMVGSWTRTFTPTLLNEVPRRLQPDVCPPVPTEQRGALDGGPRRADSDDDDVELDRRNQRHQLLQHRRQQRSELHARRLGSQRPPHLGQGQAQPPGGLRDAALRGADSQQLQTERPFPVQRQLQRQQHRRLPARLREQPGHRHRRIQGLQRPVCVDVCAGRLQSGSAPDLEPRRAPRGLAAVA